MRILITGGSGFIGRNLASQLSSSLASAYDLAAPSSSELDLLNASAVREYLGARRFDVIVHAATTRSNRGLGAPPDMLDRNCRMFFNLARNSSQFGKMIHFGSGAEYVKAGLPPRVKEEYFDTCVPTEPYGFSKYICAKYIERWEKMVELRLFAVFGQHEDYCVRFISNACCRAVKGLPIVLRQDIVFDYLYIKDLIKLTAWFIENDARHKAYNVCSGRPVAIAELARTIAQVAGEISGRVPEVSVLSGGMGAEYSGDNSRMLTEMGGYQFWDIRASIAELYGWYAENADRVDPAVLQFDSA